MDKTCSRCGNVNQYFHTTCLKCGWDLSKTFNPEIDAPFDGTPIYETNTKKPDIETTREPESKEIPVLASLLSAISVLFIISAIVVTAWLSSVDDKVAEYGLGGMYAGAIVGVLLSALVFCVISLSLRRIMLKQEVIENKLDHLLKNTRNK